MVASSGRLRPQDHLGATEQGDRPARLAMRHHGIPHLRRAAAVLRDDASRHLAPNRPIALVLKEITSNNDLGKWANDNDDGEGGNIMPFGTCLVIRQNAKSHAKIAKTLN